MFTSPHGNHSHDVPFPKMDSGFTVHIQDGDSLRYKYDAAQYEWFEHGIHIVFFDEYHNVIRRRSIPTHRISTIFEDVVTPKQIENFNEWYARTHNGMTQEEEQSMTVRGNVQVAKHKLAEIMGVDPDDIHFPFLDDEE